MALPDPNSVFGSGLPAITAAQVQQWCAIGYTGQSLSDAQRATYAVNYAEALMQDNANAYLSGPATSEEQAKALANYDTVWGYLAQILPTYGSAGKTGLQERSPGGKWDYKAYYRDPIEKDQRLSGVTGSIVSTISSIPGVSTITQAGSKIGLTGNQTLLALGLIIVIIILVIRKGF